MNKFFVNKEIYKERLNICRGCEDYFKPTGTCTNCGCFMKIKASISVMKCPVDKWLATKVQGKINKVPTHLVKEVIKIMPSIKNGKIKDHVTKAKLIELHNTIYDTTYKLTSNCASCLSTVYNGIKTIYEQYKN